MIAPCQDSSDSASGKPNGLRGMTKYLLDAVFVVVIIAVLGWLYKSTPYRWLTYYASSDPRLALVVSQSILDHGSIRLDPYQSALPPSVSILRHHGHLYDYFPLGSSVVALPAVAVARYLQWDMAESAENVRLQFLLAFGTSTFVALGLYWLARSRLPPLAAALLTVCFFFGTPLVVTLMTAYWSHNAALLCAVAALILFAYWDDGWLTHRTGIVGIAIGILAGGAYISRPTMALFCLFMAGIAWWKSWRRAVAVAIGLGLAIGVLVLFSLREYGQHLPPYYGGNRLAGAGTFFEALAGNLFSPSRGILIHAPVVGLVVIAAWWCFFRRSLSPAGFGCLMWYGLHLASISLFPHWWAGWSYGARLQVDAMPAIAFLAIELLSVGGISCRLKHPLLVVLLLGGMGWGIWIHTFQGLLNPVTAKWTKMPNIDQYPHLVWSWKYPQFLATQAAIDNRLVNIGLSAGGNGQTE